MLPFEWVITAVQTSDMGTLVSGLIFFFFFSRAVMAHQEEGPEVGQSSCCHPEHLEEVEGKIFLRNKIKLFKEKK